MIIEISVGVIAIALYFTRCYFDHHLAKVAQSHEKNRARSL